MAAEVVELTVLREVGVMCVVRGLEWKEAPVKKEVKRGADALAEVYAAPPLVPVAVAELYILDCLLVPVAAAPHLLAVVVV